MQSREFRGGTGPQASRARHRGVKHRERGREKALLAVLLLLPFHTILTLLLDWAGVRGAAFQIALVWKDVIAAVLLALAVVDASRRVASGGKLRLRPADRLALMYAAVLVLLAVVPRADIGLGDRLAGLRVDGVPLLDYRL